jgi:hypothetical protein
MRTAGERLIFRVEAESSQDQPSLWLKRVPAFVKARLGSLSAERGTNVERSDFFPAFFLKILSLSVLDASLMTLVLDA